MADEHSQSHADQPDDADERIDHIARIVKDYLREGDAFIIQCQDGDILVEEAQQTRFQKDHPRLYGRLLSMNDQLESGCGLTMGLFGLGALVCLGLHLNWFDKVLGDDLAGTLRTWWFYVPLFAVLFFVSDILYTMLEKRKYQQGRAELLELLRQEGFDRDTLVPLIKDIPEFERIVKRLKLDPGPFYVERP